MNKRYVLLASLSLALSVGVVSCISSHKAPERNVAGGFWYDIAQIFKEWNAREDFSGHTKARSLTTEDILKRATSGKLNVKEAEVIIDNDASFDSKVNMIRSAKRTIRMSYFIYGDDDSSSVVTQELIKKAKEGVKVSLLVDFITNYSKMDLFQMMMNEGNGNIDVRFYNFPSIRIQSDAIYMTLPCPKVEKPDLDSCRRHKDKIMAGMDQSKPTFFSSLFLAGLYSKNGLAMKVALGMGGDVDPAKLKGSGETSEEDMARMMEFLKLYYEAKVKHNVGAIIKLTIALFFYGEELNPAVNQISGRIPLASERETIPGKKTTHGEEWDHLTDYTHHKLVAVDAHEFQLGGRNIEDSYHMKSRIPPQAGEKPKGKYIFMDTDFRAVTVDGGTHAIEHSFDRTFNFREMVATLAEVQRVMPFDLTANNEALGIAAMTCAQLAQTGKLTTSLDKCIIKNGRASDKFVSSKVRMTAAKAAMEKAAENYTNNYARNGKKVMRDNVKGASWSPEVSKLSAADLKTAQVYYIENTSFNIKEKNPSDMVRRAGSKIGGEKFFNKNIHALWYRGLENACHVSQKEKRDVRVVLHTAYLFLPSGLVHKIAKMLNGDYGNCSRVHLTMLTNSFATTDLNVINIFARYQMVQLFSHYQGLIDEAQKYGHKRFFPKMDYYEYNAEAVGAGVSLHTKLSVLGDDMIIGSANADARSYGMDTNNAIFIRNAHNLNSDYNAFIQRLISDSSKTKEMTNEYAYMQADHLKNENNYIVGAMICRWDKKSSCYNAEDPSKVTVMKATDVGSPRFTQERITEILQTIDGMGKRISDDTYRLLNFRIEFDEIKARYNNGKNYGNPEAPLEHEMNDLANDFDDMFKVL